MNIADKRLFVGGTSGIITFLDANSLVTTVNGSTGAITNVAKTNVDNGFTLRQSISDNLGTNQVTVGGGNIDFFYGVSENTQTLVSSDSMSTITFPSTSGTLALVDGVATRVNGATGAVGMTGSGAILFTHSGKTGTFNARLASTSATGVASFNVADFVVGSTGHVGLTGTVARKNSDNSFSTLQTFNAGISAAGATSWFNSDVNIPTSTLTVQTIRRPSTGPVSIENRSNARVVIGDYDGVGEGTSIFLRDGAGILDICNPYGIIHFGDPNGINTSNYIWYDVLANTLAGNNVILDGFDSANIANLTASLGISAGGVVTFSGTVASDTGYRITSNAINAQTGTSYTLTGTDNGKIVTFNNSSAVTVTIPTGLPVGFNCTAIQLGAGQVGFTNAAGLTMQSYGNQYKMIGQHASATIIEYTTNIVNLSGNLIV